MKSGIYCITNTLSGKVYVGSAVDIKNRWQNHKASLRNNRHHSIKLQRAWNKYGECFFEFSVLESVTDVLQLIEREQLWIDSHNSALRGYNCRPVAGSNIGYKATEETRNRMSAAHKGKVKSQEHLNNIAASLRGTVGNRTGMVTPPETRAKQSKAAMGRKMPEAARAKFDAMTHEERSLASKKAWATKRARKAETLCLSLSKQAQL